MKLGVLLLMGPLLVAAAPPLIVLEPQVPQYRIAADAAKAHLSDAIEVSPQDASLAEKASAAPVVLAVGHRSFTTVRELAPSARVVFCMVLGLGRDQLGPHVTGVPLEADPASVLDHARALLPAAKRAGFIFRAGSGELWAEEMRKAAVKKGWSLVERPVQEGKDVPSATASLVGAADVLMLAPDAKLFTKELFVFLVSFAAEQKLPTIGFLESFTQAGGLAAVAADHGAVGERAGQLAAQVRAKPQTVFPLAYVPGSLSLNLKAASALGLTFPDAVVSQAKKVFR